MALCDYGVLIRRNGKILNVNNSTMDMEETLGFVLDYDIPSVDRTTDMNPHADFVGYAGDRDHFIAVYKTYACLFTRTKGVKEDYHYEVITNDDREFVCHDLDKYYSYHWWSVGHNGNRKAIELTTPDAKWEILFGYGIDCNYDIQMKYAFLYGIDIEEIEYIAKFWGQFIYVNGLKCKYDRKKQKIERSYKYKKMKGKYYIGVVFTDDVTGGRCMEMWEYQPKELPQLMEDLDNLPLPIKRFIAGVSLTEPKVALYAFCYHKTVNNETHSSSEDWDDDNFYCREYTRNEINNWRD